jgi:hypothetical protein
MQIDAYANATQSNAMHSVKAALRRVMNSSKHSFTHEETFIYESTFIHEETVDIQMHEMIPERTELIHENKDSRLNQNSASSSAWHPREACDQSPFLLPSTQPHLGLIRIWGRNGILDRSAGFAIFILLGALRLHDRTLVNVHRSRSRIIRLVQKLTISLNEISGSGRPDRTPREKKMSLSSLLSLVLLTTTLVSAANGPTAPVSIFYESAYVTARPCAAFCLWDTIFHSIDVANALSCGDSAINGCYCQADFASSASSYVSSCIRKGCANLEGVTEEVQTMMALYNGYCQTANADGVITAAVVESVAATEKSSSTRTVSLKPATGGNQNALASPTSSPSSVPTEGVSGQFTAGSGTEAPANKTDGLGRSDVIALGVGLGVGVPSVLVALATFCVQMRKRKQRMEKERFVNEEPR